MNSLEIAIVTPCHNEVTQLQGLFENLQQLSKNFTFQWIIVDDSSSDGTGDLARGFVSDFSIRVIDSKSPGRLIQGGAYIAWDEGIKLARKVIPNFTHLMKLDADVTLGNEYFLHLERYLPDQQNGILGGVISKGGREQNLHVPGPVKLYSRACLDKLSDLPRSTGFDVMDEVMAAKFGFHVIVEKNSTFSLRRDIGASQGKLHGRYRNGRVCKWTGYSKTYFLLHLLRYAFRKPLLIGAVWMIFGFINAPVSPFPEELRREHSKQQKIKLKKLLRSPISFLLETYK